MRALSAYDFLVNKKEPSEKGPEGSLALSQCAGTENVAAV